MGLKGKKVLLSGTFQGMGDVKAALEKQGAVVANGFAPDVEVVFQGKNPGGEVDDARQFGIPVKGSDALEALLTGKEAPKAQVAAYDYDDSYFRGGDDVDSYDPGYATVASNPVGVNDRPAPVRGSKQKPERPAKGAKMVEAAAMDFEKGDRVKIVSGKEGVGVIGEIFWWGESRYGDGMRAGVRGPGEDESYWVEAEHLGSPEQEIPEEVMEAAKEAMKFRKGDRVKVIEGPDSGSVGVIFWWGESKYADGMRAGIECDDGDKVWADAAELEKADGGGGASADVQDDYNEDDIPF